jgi:hypothetical protein
MDVVVVVSCRLLQYEARENEAVVYQHQRQGSRTPHELRQPLVIPTGRAVHDAARENDE